MKRFYTDVSVSVSGGLQLDGRPVRTPGRAPLVLPSAALAEAIAAEWVAQGDTIDMRSMPLTGLANAAIDIVSASRDAFVADLGRYALTDVLCYRASEPPSLVDRQRAHWDPLLAWAQARFDIAFVTTMGVVPVSQPAQTTARLQAALSAYDAFCLAGLSPLVTIGGSLVTALAVIEAQISASDGFAACHLDELWQADRYGEEWSSAEARALRRGDFEAAARFCALASS